MVLARAVRPEAVVTMVSRRAVGVLGGLIASWRFPVFALASLTSFKLVMAGLLLVPAGSDVLGEFAEQFRIWCFGKNPETGRYEQAYLWTMFLEPLFFGVIIAATWSRPLVQGWRTERRKFWPWALAGALSMVVVGTTFVAWGAAAATRDAALTAPDATPFPEAAMRISVPAPELELTAHDGTPVSLAALQGKVVVLTSVYARCNATCPMIMRQAKAVVSRLEATELADLRVLAITMDPEHDTPERLAALAASQGVARPTYTLATGVPAEVEAALDRLDISRRKDPETGVITHANVFIVIDREGRIAYKLTLGEQQEAWLTQAIRGLLREG